MKEFIGEGLLTSDGEHWRKQRRIAQPAFHMKEIASMAATMTRITEETLATWPDEAGPHAPIDIAERFMQLTLRIAGITLFNVDLSDESASFGRAAKIALEFLVRRTRSLVRVPLSVPTPDNRRFLEAKETLDAVIHRLIKERRSGASPPQGDLLQLLLDARDPDTGEGMNDKELRDELITMLGAGHETTAIALTWTTYFLSKIPSVREELEREIESVLGDRTPAFEDVQAQRMPYTKMVLEESMRLRSPFWMTGRKAVAEDLIGKVAIPAGTEVILCPYITHRHPDFWPNPEGFDPRRFSAARAKDRHSCAFMPFGAGPQKCIGMAFAMMELQLVLPMVVRAFEINLMPGADPQVSPGLTLRPRDGCWMTLKRRGKSAGG
jgi:cytochrome P450